MHSIYRKIDATSLAVLDVTEYYGEGYIITRINVPRKHRSQGIARSLLQECCNQADRTKITLWLEIQSSDGLSFEQLEAWYRRHGFRGDAIGVMRRKPSPVPLDLT